MKGSMKEKNNISYKIWTGVTIGAFSGIVICSYRFFMKLCDDALNQHILPFLHEGSRLHVLLWAFVVVVLAYIVHHLIRFEPAAKGGGIPHAIQETAGTSDARWWSVIISKITAAPLCNLAGLSLGKTGPAVELGAMSGKGAGIILHKLAKKKTDPAVCSFHGCAAGLAALFNAPLAGMWFASEKLHKKDGLSGMTTLISAFVAAGISITVFGYTPIVDIALPVHDWRLYANVAVLAIFLGVLGVFYDKSLSFVTGILSDKRISQLVLWIAVFLISGSIQYFAPALTGGGSNMLAVMTESTTLRLLVLLLTGKYLFSMLSSGSGLPGGTVFPLLTVGACIGQIFGTLTNILFPSLGISPVTFILPGMAGFFSSVLGAPLTGMFLLCEFSSNYNNLPPLLVVCVLSGLISRKLRNVSPYRTVRRHNE